jgi:hypothetical protein
MSAPSLYEKSVKAAHKYFRDWPKPINDIAKAGRTAHFEMYRTGWIIGYQDALKISKRRKSK